MRKIELRYKRKALRSREQRLIRLAKTPQQRGALETLYMAKRPMRMEGYQARTLERLAQWRLVEKVGRRGWAITVLGRELMLLRKPWWGPGQPNFKNNRAKGNPLNLKIKPIPKRFGFELEQVFEEAGRGRG